MKHYLLKTSMMSLSAAIVLTTTGCSSDNANTDITPAQTNQSGTAIDGILIGSTVCIDVNRNSACDADEDSDVTDDKGKFNIESKQTGPLLLIGGLDEGTGLPFTGSLSAPSGSSVVTPNTSMIQSLVETGISAEEAETLVKVGMGIDPSVDLTHLDPFAAMEDPNLSDEEKVKVKQVLISQAKIQTLVHAASVVVAGADAQTNTADVMNNVFDEISKNFTGEEVQLSADELSSATRAVANDVYKENEAAKVAVKSTADGAADEAVEEAEKTKKAVEEADSADDILEKFNTGIKEANTKLEEKVDDAVEDAKEKADALSEAELKAIADAQAEREAKEAEIAAAKAAADKAAADLIAAQEAAAADAQNKALYEAVLEAKAELERQKAAEAAAETAALEAAAKAAAEEAKIAADEEAAAKAAAEALAQAKAKAQAEEELAKIKIAAAEKAAADAKAAEDIAAAQAAVLAAEAAADKAAADKAAADKAAADKAAADKAAADKAAADKAAADKAAADKAAADKAAADKAAADKAAADKAAADKAAAGDTQAADIRVQDSLRTLAQYDPQNNSLSSTLASTKNSLQTSNDEKILLALIDIVQILDSQIVTDLVSQDSTLSNLDLLTSEVDTEVLVRLADAATTSGGTAILHQMASKLKTASDTLTSGFASEEKTLEYTDDEGEVIAINYNDSLVLRGMALSTAAILDLTSSYTYGNIDSYRPKEKTIDGEVYEYSQGQIDPLSLINQSTFFKMSNTPRIANAYTYLTTALDYISQIDVSDTSLTDMLQEDIDEATRIKNSLNTTGSVSDSESGDSIKLSALFSTSQFIDRNDFNIPTNYMGESNDVIAEYAKLEAQENAYADYEVAKCQDPSIAEFNEEDINEDLANSQRMDTVVTLQENLSIMNGSPVYASGMQMNGYDVQNDCSIRFYGDGHPRFEAFGIKITPKDNLQDLSSIELTSPEFTSSMIEGKTFYVLKEEGDDHSRDRIITELKNIYNSNGTRSFEVDGGTYTGNYEIIDGEIHDTTDDGTSIILVLKEIDDNGAMHISLLNEYRSHIASLTYFSTQAELNDVVPASVTFTGKINFLDFDGNVVNAPENIIVRILPVEHAYHDSSYLNITSDGSFNQKIYTNHAYDADFPLEIFIDSSNNHWEHITSTTTSLTELSNGIDVQLPQSVLIFGLNLKSHQNVAKMEVIGNNLKITGTQGTQNEWKSEHISTGVSASSIKVASQFIKVVQGSGTYEEGSFEISLSYETTLNGVVKSGDALIAIGNQGTYGWINFDHSSQDMFRWNGMDNSFDVSAEHTYEIKLDENSNTINFYIDNAVVAIFSQSMPAYDSIRINHPQIRFNNNGEAIISDIVLGVPATN